MAMIEHNRPTIGLKESRAASKVLASGYVSQGSEVEKFENEFCDFMQLPENHAVALSSGTAALFMSLFSLDLQKKVIAMPTYTCSALRNASAMLQAKELLIDSEIGSPNICRESLKLSGADAAIVPHMFGIPSDIRKVKDVKIIEDCAQSLGASIDGEKVGLIGDVGIFSFYATKLMTSGGQGGMFVSRDQGLVDKVRDFRDFDCRKDRKYRFNFQMTDLQAAIGRVQLKKLPNFLERREEIFEQYKCANLPLIEGINGHPVYYRAVIAVEDPDKVINRLLDCNVRSIVPIRDWGLLDDGPEFKYARQLTKSTISLPIYPSLTNRDVRVIINALEKSL